VLTSHVLTQFIVVLSIKITDALYVEADLSCIAPLVNIIVYSTQTLVNSYL